MIKENHLNFIIDGTFFLSLMSVVPLAFILSVYAGIGLTVVILSGMLLYHILMSQRVNSRRSELIHKQILQFIKTNNYDDLKLINYQFPIATLFCLTGHLTKDEILDLDFIQLKHKEYRPDLGMIKILLEFFEDTQPDFSDLDEETFLADFLHYYAETKTR